MGTDDGMGWPDDGSAAVQSFDTFAAPSYGGDDQSVPDDGAAQPAADPTPEGSINWVNDADALAQAGTLYENGDYENATRVAQALLDSGAGYDDPMTPYRAIYGQVMCLDRQHQLPAAADLLDRLIAMIPTHPNVARYRLQSQGYRAGQQWDEPTLV